MIYTWDYERKLWKEVIGMAEKINAILKELKEHEETGNLCFSLYKSLEEKIIGLTNQ